MLQWLQNNSALALTILYVIGSNAAKALPKPEEVTGKKLSDIVYEFLYTFVNGVMQNIGRKQ